MSELGRGVGDNSGDIDFAKIESDRLVLDYAELNRVSEELIVEAEGFTAIDDDASKMKVVSLIKRIRDAATRANGFREAEKMPHFRRGQGVDSFFFGIIDRLSRRDKKARPGVADRLQAMLTDYDNRKLAEEQERRRLAAEAAAREQKRLADLAAEQARKAEEARIAAERARAPAQVEKKAEIAAVAETTASAAQIDATLQAGKAEEAYVETLAKPADIMRTRGDDGTLSTVAREGYAEITFAPDLDAAALWPHISLGEKEKALRQWARSTGYTTQMKGAAIGFRNKSIVR